MLAMIGTDSKAPFTVGIIAKVVNGSLIIDSEAK
jgi:hypothetical protein